MESSNLLFSVIADNIIVAERGSAAVVIELGFLQNSYVDLVCCYLEGKLRCLTTDDVAVRLQ